MVIVICVIYEGNTIISLRHWTFKVTEKLPTFLVV